MQFFQSIHYKAFEDPKPRLDDVPTRREREEVKEKLLELDERLWPFIQNKNWDLHRHRQVEHYVSSTHFVFLPDGRPIVNFIDGLWLHYGKSPEQLDFVKLIGGGYDYKGYDDDEYYNAFYLHTRIQFYINAKVFRCWLLLATDKNYYDRSEFLKKIREKEKERDKFYLLIKSLFDKKYFYEINGERLDLKSSLLKENLMKFIKKDKHGYYSGIVKEYTPDDMAISESNIIAEMKTNLELLYLLYDFMAWRPRLVY